MSLLVGLAIACVHIAGASASTFTVDSAADAGDSNTGDGLCDDGTGHCTLRAAIQQADASGGANTINVPAGSYLLSAGNLIVTNPTNNLAIVGTGAAGTVIIDGQSTLQIFNLQGGTITLSNLVIQNGKFTIANPGAFGACVGGGIFAGGAATINIDSSIIQNNAAVNGTGGGLCILQGTVNLDRSTVRNNSSTYGGSGVRIQAPGILNVTNSTFNGNTASDSNASGAAIETQSTVSVANSTISGNSLAGPGSGIAVIGATATLKNVTIAGNGPGPQLSVFSTGGSAILESTIISNPNAGVNCNVFDNGVVTSNGHNLDNASTCGLANAGDITGDPMLGPLQNNGGPTSTRALLSGSPAIDHGSNPGSLAADQRGVGFARVAGAAADIGAFEAVGLSGPPTLDVDASNSATKYDALTDGLLVIRYLFGLAGPPLTNGALGATATRTDPLAVKVYLDAIRAPLDIDGNGTTDALTDGLLIIRYLFGLRGDPLIAKAVDPLGKRTTAADIETYMKTLLP
jgi:CSLREA domain-containing protein